MTVIANVFPILWTAKDMARQMSKKPRFRTPFDSQHIKGSQTLVKSTWQGFYQVFSALSEKFSWMIHASASNILIM